MRNPFGEDFIDIMLRKMGLLLVKVVIRLTWLEVEFFIWELFKKNNSMAYWIVGFTVIVVYFLDRWENQSIKSVFDWVPAILLAYLIPAGISALLDQDFAQHEIHGF